ncbi:MAG: hypothetical protein ACKO86_17110, partial [Dolichospermum sp.]
MEGELVKALGEDHGRGLQEISNTKSSSPIVDLCVKNIIAFISNTTENICRDVTVIEISEKSVNLPFRIKDCSINSLASEG